MLKEKRFRLQRFVLGKTAKNTLHGQTKLKYQRNVEKALVISILAAIFGVRLAANFDINKYVVKESSVNFETIDIPLIQPIIEPPAMKMEEVVEVKPEEKEEDSNLEEIEELLGENDEEAELALNSNDLGAYLLSSSPLGSISGPDFKLREQFDDGGGNISLKSNKSYESLLAESDLDIGTNHRGERKPLSNDVNIDLTQKTDPRTDPGVEQTFDSDDVSLNISGVPERILTFSFSTIGTEDYKLWNKINAELDRLNKGRYGSVPKEIERNRRGFIVNLRYPDGVRHEIHWQIDGNVWIKIIGQSHKTALQELRRALNALLRLSL